MSLLCVQGLRCRFRHRWVLDGLEFSVNEGEIFALLGPNGAGKSTAFRILVGLEDRYQGQLSYRGKPLLGALWQRARLGIGYLPQQSVALWKLSVAENILIPLRQKGKSDPGPLLQLVGLEDMAQAKAEQLSGGERRRMELARCLALEPQLMVLDEPFAALDPLAIEQFSAVLSKLRQQGMAILFSDHAVAASLRLCDRAAVIDQGVMIAVGCPAEIVEKDVVRQRYLGNNFSF